MTISRIGITESLTAPGLIPAIGRPATPPEVGVAEAIQRMLSGAAGISTALASMARLKEQRERKETTERLKGEMKDALGAVMAGQAAPEYWLPETKAYYYRTSAYMDALNTDPATIAIEGGVGESLAAYVADMPPEYQIEWVRWMAPKYGAHIRKQQKQAQAQLVDQGVAAMSARGATEEDWDAFKDDLETTRKLVVGQGGNWSGVLGQIILPAAEARARQWGDVKGVDKLLGFLGGASPDRAAQIKRVAWGESLARKVREAESTERLLVASDAVVVASSARQIDEGQAQMLGSLVVQRRQQILQPEITKAEERAYAIIADRELDNSTLGRHLRETVTKGLMTDKRALEVMRRGREITTFSGYKDQVHKVAAAGGTLPRLDKRYDNPIVAAMIEMGTVAGTVKGATSRFEGFPEPSTAQPDPQAAAAEFLRLTADKVPSQMAGQIGISLGHTDQAAVASAARFTLYLQAVHPDAAGAMFAGFEPLAQARWGVMQTELFRSPQTDLSDMASVSAFITNTTPAMMNARPLELTRQQLLNTIFTVDQDDKDKNAGNASTSIVMSGIQANSKAGRLAFVPDDYEGAAKQPSAKMATAYIDSAIKWYKALRGGGMPSKDAQSLAHGYAINETKVNWRPIQWGNTVEWAEGAPAGDGGRGDKLIGGLQRQMQARSWSEWTEGQIEDKLRPVWDSDISRWKFVDKDKGEYLYHMEGDDKIHLTVGDPRQPPKKITQTQVNRAMAPPIAKPSEAPPAVESERVQQIKEAIIGGMGNREALEKHFPLTPAEEQELRRWWIERAGGG